MSTPQATPSAANSGRRKIRAAIVAIISNTVLIAVKLAAGLATGSVGILSDAVHSLMDLVAAGLSFASVRKSDEPADSSHRYGHEKLEDLSASGQAVLLLVGAVFVLYESIRRLVIGGKVDSAVAGMIVVALAAVVNIFVSAYLTRTGRATQSGALAATAADLRTDAVLSAGVFVALLAVRLTGLDWIDAAAGVLIAVVISSTGVRVLTAATRRLVDESLPDDELAALETVINGFIGDEVVGYHDLRARHVGSAHQVDLHLQFARGTSLERAHELSHRLQDAMSAHLPATTVLIHLEPEDRVREDRFTTTP